MKKAIAAILMMLGVWTALPAQEARHGVPFNLDELLDAELHRHSARKPVSMASTWLDVTYYGLDLSITTNPNFIRGSVRVSGVCVEDTVWVLRLDLAQTMQIDSVLVDGDRTSFQQYDAWFDIFLDNPRTRGEALAVDIHYGGLPIGTGFGSFVFSTHNGYPWIWSLSEPYGAKDWWPCKDTPQDKADSADVFITCDSALQVGSNGKLVSVALNGDGTATTHWSERYPIASYLISVAITKYAQFSNWFRYSPTDSMEVLNYVLEENLGRAMTSLPQTVRMLEIFSGLFGLYPFIEEKYGHADFGWGGAMEHQTMTSTTTYSEPIIAHELAHQWFGDMITCRTWPDIWLNEGFAHYATALYLEREYGIDSYWSFMNTQIAAAKNAPGSIHVRDTSVVRELFNGALVYAKGATVLHMLRHVLGDSIFFAALYAYANDPRLRYHDASTSDFMGICESVSGRDLGYYFSQWIYGEKYPRYTYSWNAVDSAGLFYVGVSVTQSTGTLTPEYFTMPVDLRFLDSTHDTTIVVFNNQKQQTFQAAFPWKPDSVALDPGRWILSDVSQNTLYVDRRLPLPTALALHQNYPNPFNATTEIRVSLPHASVANLRVYNVLGEEVAVLLQGSMPAGEYTVRWDASTLPSAMYVCVLRVGQEQRVTKIVLTR